MEFVQGIVRALAVFLLSTCALAADPVIVLDYTGGFTPSRVSKEPYLQIFEDGTIRARNPLTKDKPREDKMTKEAVKKLVAELAPKVKTPTKLPKDALQITDASTTVIRVGKKSAKQYALGFLATKLPKHKQVQALWAARNRLDLIYNVTMAGGEKMAKVHLAAANKALKKEWPKAKPFHLGEMSVYRDEVTFRRTEKKRSIAIKLVKGKVHVDKSG
ncbi:MAG: hypothetical protein ACYTGZ_18030 [Planctomycetota bacterium]